MDVEMERRMEKSDGEEVIWMNMERERRIYRGIDGWEHGYRYVKEME